MAKIVMQHTLNYIYKTDPSKLDNIMEKGHDKRNIGKDNLEQNSSSNFYYVIQDTIVEEDNTTEENNTTDKDTPMCVETKFEIIKHTNFKAN